MRILGLDLGEKRIGVAISDPNAVIAQARPFVDGTSANAAVSALAEMVRAEEVERIVVGLPLNMDGSEGRSALKAREFASLIGTVTGVKVVLWDERLTTREAERVMISADVSRKKRKKAIDGLAAVLILQSYLDSLPGDGEKGSKKDGS